eukprot:gene34214-41414_t
MAGFYPFFCIISFLVITLLTRALKTVYIIRHCDEDDNPDDPCCNSLGYDRSVHWYEAIDFRLTSSKLHLYTASADYNNDVSLLCKPNIQIDSKGSCRKSQRHAITANYFRMTSGHEVDMDVDYCVDDYKELVSDIETNAKDMKQ